MGKKGFTLVELMIVILIVAILAAVAIPLMSGRIDAAKWSEAKAGMGTIATGVRAYYAEHGCNTTATPTGLTQIGIATHDLDGTYFVTTDYHLTGATCNTGTGQITLVASCGTSKTGAPTNPATLSMTVSANSGGGVDVAWSDGTVSH